jgi:chitin-binding protein
VNLRRKLGTALAATVLVVGSGLVLNVLTPSPAAAHGATMFPGSRQFLCWQHADTGGNPAPTNPMCQGLLANGNDPHWNWFGNLSSSNDGAVPIADGRICDGDDTAPFNFSAINNPGPWPFTHVTAGATYEFRFNNWAAHPGRFDIYLTTQGFNPNSQLNWSDLELIDTVVDPPQSGGPGSLNYYFWDQTLPGNRSGQHIMFIHWVRSDSPEDFFACSDLSFDGGNGEVTIPGDDDPPPPPPPPPCQDPNAAASVPGPALISGISTTGAVASWGQSTGCATAYELVNIEGGGEEVLAEVTGQPAPTTANITGLSPDTAYRVAVRARNDNIGQVTGLTDAAPFTTLSDDDPPPPPPGECTVSYDLNDWGAGFTAEVTVVNNSASTVNGWDLDFSLAAGQSISQVWNAVETATGVSNAAWNSTIGANGGSANFGFLGNPGGASSPNAFTLNGTACAVG